MEKKSYKKFLLFTFVLVPTLCFGADQAVEEVVVTGDRYDFGFKPGYSYSPYSNGGMISPATTSGYGSYKKEPTSLKQKCTSGAQVRRTECIYDASLSHVGDVSRCGTTSTPGFSGNIELSLGVIKFSSSMSADGRVTHCTNVADAYYDSLKNACAYEYQKTVSKCSQYAK